MRIGSGRLGDNTSCRATPRGCDRCKTRAVVLAVRVVVLVGLAARACTAGDAPIRATPPEPFGSSGRWITDATGRVIIPRGVNMVAKLPPYSPAHAGFGAKDAAVLAREGFNVVRVGVIYSAVEPAPGVYNDDYLRNIRSTVAVLHRYGILSVIDFHQDLWGPAFDAEGFPRWATLTDGLATGPDFGLPDSYFKVTGLQRAFDHFWMNTPGPLRVGIQDRFAAAWAHTARILKHTPGILGWEVLNEPFPGSDWARFVAPPWNPQADRTVLTGFYERVIRAIRTVDTEHIIWCEPWITFDLGAPTFLGKLNHRRVGFAFHNYIGIHAIQWPYIQAQEYGARMGVPILATEFGALDDPAVVVQQLDIADRFMMPAIYWTYWDRTPYFTSNGLVSGGYGEAQGLVNDLRLPPVGDNLKEAKLAALVRPYPRAVAGTPLEWSYDAASGVFEFDYACGSPLLSRHSETEISVPRRHYPNGYVAAVTGGKVVSAPGAPILRVVNGGRASRVSVRIKPRSRPGL